MSEAKRDLAASVSARLLNLAKKSGEDFQTLLTAYCFERFLYRLGKSSGKDRYILKGAMLLRLWSVSPYRATRDLDMLCTGESSHETVRKEIESICTMDVEPDGIRFSTEKFEIEDIRTEGENAGTRVKLEAYCGPARLSLQIDMGLGDSVWPVPGICRYPSLLDFPEPEILAYPREAVIAEKLDAIVVLGDSNSRIKDFFDIHYLASHFSFDRATLVRAIEGTFSQRRTPCPAETPFGLTQAYWSNSLRLSQIRAFSKRSHIQLTDTPAENFIRLLQSFLLPLLDDLTRRSHKEGVWNPGGPWEAPRA